ncbi:hypothetical protein LRS06_03520 [Hymenobacter sp. J193]|uniref:hypothetical protein n=1 Tax=Hymenobacter sp. J193 TaxID=2898429 RepID=UPI002151A134|nr:hypothetical protein [Hymenobacter sp. J193]MCR5886856.1 hypothetical protein [Hymenobacter sp. J193]
MKYILLLFYFLVLCSIETIGQSIDGYVINIYSKEHNNIENSLLLSQQYFRNSSEISVDNTIWYAAILKKETSGIELMNCCRGLNMYKEYAGRDSSELAIYKNNNYINCNFKKYCAVDENIKKSIFNIRFGLEIYFVTFFKFEGDVCSCYQHVRASVYSSTKRKALRSEKSVKKIIRSDFVVINTINTYDLLYKHDKVIYKLKRYVRKYYDEISAYSNN